MNNLDRSTPTQKQLRRALSKEAHKQATGNYYVHTKIDRLKLQQGRAKLRGNTN